MTDSAGCWTYGSDTMTLACVLDPEGWRRWAGDQGRFSMVDYPVERCWGIEPIKTDVVVGNVPLGCRSACAAP